MPSPTFSSAVENEMARAIADLNEARQLLQHQPSVGAVVEQAVERLIRRFIPDSLTVTAGFAVNAAGEMSRQQDLLVVRNERTGPLATYAGFGVYPVENVIAAIEVKTTLTTSEIDSAFDAVASVRTLAPDTPGRDASHIQSSWKPAPG